MNTPRRVFIGPHLRCLIEYATETYPVCVSESCARKGSPSRGGRHCRECGEKLGSIELPTQLEMVTHDDLEGEDFKSCLSADGKHRLFFPCGRGTGRQMLLDPEVDDWYQNFGDVLILHETRWFQNAYAAEVKAVRKAYGKLCVETTWGSFVVESEV